MSTDKLWTLASEQQTDGRYRCASFVYLVETDANLSPPNKRYIKPLLHLSIPLFGFESLLPVIQLITK